MAVLEEVEFFRATGVLPHGGGRNDQHPRFIEALRVVEEERAKLAELKGA